MMNELEQRAREVRKDFPLFETDDIAYLDNAATTQKPRFVLDAIGKYYEELNANPFRGVYRLSEKSTESYEAARCRVAKFINAPLARNIVFTRNASESLNLIAYSYGSFIKEGDEIAVSVAEHHSNFLPWKNLAEKTGAVLKRIEPDKEGYFSEEAVRNAVSEKTKIVAITHVSNVFGRINDIKKFAEIAHSVGAVIVADGAQSVPHIPVDVQELDVDFLVFSGHKMLAPMGIGGLYGRTELLEKMPPFMQGGEMIEIVHWDRVRYAEVPHKFEAGTVNAGGAYALGAAVDYMNKLGFDFIHGQEMRLSKMMVEGVKAINGVNLIGSQSPDEHCGIVTFTIDGVHPHDIASIFDSDNIAVRAGHHCAQPLMDYLGVNSTTRASLGFYNTEDDVNRFLNTLEQIRGRMGYGR